MVFNLHKLKTFHIKIVQVLEQMEIYTLLVDQNSLLIKCGSAQTHLKLNNVASKPNLIVCFEVSDERRPSN